MQRVDWLKRLRFNPETSNIKTIGVKDNKVKIFEPEESGNEDMLVVNGGKSDWSPALTKEYNKLGLAPYTWKEINGVDDAVAKSANNLIDLIRYYEGHGENYTAKTNYKDTVNVSTYGYGLTVTAMKAIGNYDNKNKKVINKPNTQAKAYEQLLKYLNNISLTETKKYLGDVKYDNLPQGVKAALLDYHFKNGYAVMNKSDLKSKLQETQKSNSAENWAAVLKELVYTMPASSKAEKKDNPGLHRRSLSRVILAAKDLKNYFSSPKDKATIDKTVKEIYEAGVKCAKDNGLSTTDFDRIYNSYVAGNTSAKTETPKTSSNNDGENKYVVPSQMGLFSVAKAIIPEKAAEKNGIDPKELRIAVINEIMLLNDIKSDGVDDNGYPKVRLLESGEQLDIPTLVEVNGKIIKLKVPDNWETVNLQVQNEDSSSSDDESAGDEESVRILDLLYGICQNPTWSDIGTDRNLQCAAFKYKVQKGDTIYRLALRYGVDWKTLLADNNMTVNSVLQVDDEIKINKIIYTVKNGDNLTQIAKRYGLTVDYIRDVNNLENVDRLAVGQQLEFPGYVYTVKKGDNLVQISKKVGVDIAELEKLNGLKAPYTLKPSQKLLVLFNDADYNVSDTNKITTVDEKGNTITTVKSDNVSLAGRLYLKPKKVNGKYKASKHVFEPTKSGNLNGKTIIVNAGHGYKTSGTYDGGTPGRGGLDDEWLLNYDNAMRLIKQMNERGAKVIFLQGYRSLVTQEFPGCGKVDMFISVHVNSAENTKDRTQFFYRGDLKNDNSWGTRSKKFAEIAEKKFDNWIPNHETIKNNEKFYNNGVQDYAQASVNDGRTGILKKAISSKHVPSIIWEVAYMTTAKGRERLGSSALMDSYASVMASAVEEYFDTYKTAPSTSSATATQSSDNKYKMHTVKKDESLNSIAKKYGVTVDQIKKLNGLKNNKIIVGQKLKIKKKS